MAPPDPTFQLLHAHHEELERLCLGLLAETLADDPRELVACWRQFERLVLEHMAMEQEILLPGYGAFDARDAREISDEHGSIVAALNRLGLEIELHTIRERTVRSLVELLHAHAAREEAGLYVWAGHHLDPRRRREILMRLELAA